MMGLIGLVTVAVALFAGLLLVVMYNGLVSKKNQVENAFSCLDVMLQQRFDLIPNLVATVKRYLTHEAETLVRVTETRAAALRPGAAERVQAENQLTQALSGVMVAVESYPQLKADANFRQLQAALNEVEERIAAARRSYNAAVTELNNAIEMFPSSVLAAVLGYRRRELFETPPAQRENVKVADLFAP